MVCKLACADDSNKVTILGMGHTGDKCNAAINKQMKFATANRDLLDSQNWDTCSAHQKQVGAREHWVCMMVKVYQEYQTLYYSHTSTFPFFRIKNGTLC